MKFGKVLGIATLSALLAIPAGSIHKTPNIHASVRQVSLPYSYRGTWGANRAYGPKGTRSRSDKIAAKFYKYSGYFENTGYKNSSTNGLQHFAKPRTLHGVYASLPMNYRASDAKRLQAEMGFKLSRNHHTMNYFIGNERWYMHRISNRSYQSIARSIQNYKKRNHHHVRKHATKRHSRIHIRKTHQSKRNTSRLMAV